ncbi:ecdysone-induced protein 75B, isoforms C/D [Hetaerina americana]|uniref:ecdysone-induced protein 75B, isoforms C/D n=1 Tax=Hetaerina americana TaxID=62018 RepID=UPI003A7F49CA
MVVPGEMKVKPEDDRLDAGASSVQVTNHQHNHLPILKGILDGVVKYHNAPVRFGRVPKREKARILAAMHQSCQSRSAERAAVAEQLNGVSANQVDGVAAVGASEGGSTPPAAASQVQHGAGAQPQHGAGAQAQHGAGAQSAESVKEEQGGQVVGDWAPGPAEDADGELEATRLAQTVLRAHSDTCHFAHLRPKEGACPRAGSGPVYSVPGRNGPILACPLNPRRPLVAGLTPDPNGRGEDTLLQDFSQRFSPAIRGVVEFAKRIPGFALLSQSDQVTLLKAGVFEVLLLRLACLFDAQTNTMTCLNGELLRRESIVSHHASSASNSPSSSPSRSPTAHASNARFLVDSMFEFAARLNSLQLSDAELALFSAVVIIAPDRPGLRHTDLISRIHSRLMSSLSLLLHSHPNNNGNNASGNNATALMTTLQSYIPDLRTLNTLHSEKLLAFKMTEQQQQGGNVADCAESASNGGLAQRQQQMPGGGRTQGEDQCKQYATLSTRHAMPEHSAMGCRQQQACARPVSQGMHISQQVMLTQCPRQQHVVVDDPLSMDTTTAVHQSQHPQWKGEEEEVQEVIEDIIEEEDEQMDKWTRENHSGHSHHNTGIRGPVVSGLKSPLGSVSSSESICSGEVASLSEFRNATTSVSASAPLLAASLSGTALNGISMNNNIQAIQGFPKRRRHRDRSESNSEEDTSCGMHLSNASGNSVQATQIPAHRATYFRKLDSPSDSGIESGTERLEKSSTSTSVCSSPRSSLEDKDDVLQQHKGSIPAQVPPTQRSRCPHMDRPSAVEDMPVLKRVLQAPPLYDTNSLMDEAYKPHKKFRALRKDSAEAEALANSPVTVLSSPSMDMPRMSGMRIESVGGQRSERSSYSSLEVARDQGRSEMRLSSPPVVVLSPPANPTQSASPHSIISTLNIHLPQITIHAQPMRIVSPTEQQQQQQQQSQPATIHPVQCSPSAQNRLSPQAGGSGGQSSSGGNPPLLLQKALLQPPANQRSLQSHQHQALLSALSADTSPRSSPVAPLTASLLQAPTLNSSLSSTHSTLARSLMEGPKMTAEQMKRTDIIHSYIMREGGEESSSQGLYWCGKTQQGSYRSAKVSPDPTAVMSGLGHEMSNVDDGYRSGKVVAQQGYGGNTSRGQQQQGCVSGKEQSPGVLVFNGSYHSHSSWNGEKPQCPQQQQQQQAASVDGVQVMTYSPAPSPGKPEPKQGGQPLNLSKKTPPPSPATTPVISASILEA